MRPILAAMLVSMLPAWSFAGNALTNYKSGISIKLNGTDNKNYVFERWYHDPLIDDHGVVYIKSNVKIALEHNERNNAWVQYRYLRIVDKRKGTLRYKIDRDLNQKYAWEEGTEIRGGAVLPEFKAPFAFDDLTYAPDDPGVKVVGTVGPKPGVDIQDRRKYYHRGMRDSAGDEWHIITVGDGDKWTGKQLRQHVRTWGSDGKIHYFIVNPKTPAIYLKKVSEQAQFYTTPPKNYFVPKIYDQTSYVTDGVSINLVNITNSKPIRYRLDDGEVRTYRGPISTDSLSVGKHKLEVYFNSKHRRVRTIVKNPPFPSDKDVFAHDKSGHGYLLWRNDREFEALCRRVTAPDSPHVHLKKRYTTMKRVRNQYGNGQEVLDAIAGKGIRWSMAKTNYPLANALVAKIEGLDKAKDYASYARRMILESPYLLDPVGYELDHNFSAMPTYELVNTGYYQAQALMSVAAAYDLLIMDFRAPEYKDGFTAIEDLRIRDAMAQFVYTALMYRGAYIWTQQEVGMWGGARNVGALFAAMAMPSYRTRYRGTSGFDGQTRCHPWQPFPDQPVTWKRALLDGGIPIKTYPNQQGEFGILNTKVNFRHHYGHMMKNVNNGSIEADGRSRIGAYTSYHLMGRMFGIYSNILKIKFDQQPAYLVPFFTKCIEGSQGVSHRVRVGYYPNPLIVNRYHPQSLATKGWSTMNGKGDIARMMDAWSLAFMHGDPATWK